MGKSSSKLRLNEKCLQEHWALSDKSTSSTTMTTTDEAQLTLILDDQQLFLPFLTQVFYQEVELSDCRQTLFRGNCLASRIMSHCFRNYGSRYLKELLEPHIEPLSKMYSVQASPTNENNSMQQGKRSTSSSCLSNSLDIATYTENNNHPPASDNNNKQTPSYEIDPSRLNLNENISPNQENLLHLTKQILDSILLSGQHFPPQLSSMCVCLRQILDKKFPDSDTGVRAVATVIFLRFINPAIVSPYESGIVESQPHPRVMRGLMLVSKILQNIANNVEFSKEEHMLPFNNFVRQQFEPIRNWISEILCVK